MIKLKNISVIFAVLTLILSTSCVETVLVASAATGTLLLREKSFDNTRKDTIIASKLAADFIKAGLKTPGNSIDITVNEGRVLLTGIIRNPNKIKLASELAWKVSGVKEVIDEIQVSEDSRLHLRDVSQASIDYALSVKIDAKLLAKRGVASVNYKVTTVNGTVYLIGIAANDRELQKVLTFISEMRGVEKIVNHVIIADDIRRKR